MAVNVGQRHVPETEMTLKCYAVDAALELLCHTLRNCKHKKFVNEGYKETVADKITQIATDIYMSAYTANRIRLNAENWERRNALQVIAIEKCNDLIAMINVAKRALHLRRGKTEYWVKLTVTTRELLTKWREANTKAANL